METKCGLVDVLESNERVQAFVVWIERGFERTWSGSEQASLKCEVGMADLGIPHQPEHTVQCERGCAKPAQEYSDCAGNCLPCLCRVDGMWNGFCCPLCAATKVCWVLLPHA